MYVFGIDEIFYIYNPCNSSELMYTDGNIVSKQDGNIVLDKDVVYYIKAVSLFSVSALCVIVVYYITS